MQTHLTQRDLSGIDVSVASRSQFEYSGYSTIVFDFDGVIAPAGRILPEDFSFSEQALLSHPGIQHELIQHVAYGLIGVAFSLRQVNSIYHNKNLYGGSYWDLIEAGLHSEGKFDSNTVKLLLPDFIEAYNYVAMQFAQRARIENSSCLSTEQNQSLELLYALPLTAYESFFNFLDTWQCSVPNGQATIYTASPVSYVMAMIKHMNLPEFVLIQGCDALWTKKGKDKSWPLALLDLLQNVNASAEHTLVIDDNLSLLKGAAATKCKGILFAGHRDKIPDALNLATQHSDVYITRNAHDLRTIL